MLPPGWCNNAAVRLYFAIAIGAALFLLALGIFPVRFWPAPDVSLVSTLIAGAVMTAYLLVVHTIQRRSASTALLACAYIVAISAYNFASPALALLVHVRAYPSAAVSFVAHAGFALCFGAFALVGARRPAHRLQADPGFNLRVTLLLGGSAVCTVVAVAVVRWIMIADPTTTTWLTWLQGPLALVALALFVLRARPTISNTWLALALFASGLDSFMIVASPPASLGIFVGQAFGLVACVVIPVAYLIEFNRQYAWLSQSNQRFRRQALTDELTGLGNRRYYDARLEAMFKDVSGLSNAQFALLAIDIDHFKKYNDSYGHAAGDECLRRISAVLKSSMFRPEDEALRYGGEEFVALLPGSDINGARMVAERIRSRVYDLAIEHGANDCGRVTVSIGIAVAPQHGISPDHLFSNADAALYAAKNQGRNRLAEPTPERNITAVPTVTQPSN